MEALAKDRDRVEAYLNSVDLKMALEGQEMKTQLETTWPYFKLRGELKTVLDVSDVPYHITYNILNGVLRTTGILVSLLESAARGTVHSHFIC